MNTEYLKFLFSFFELQYKNISIYKGWEWADTPELDKVAYQDL